MILDRHAPTLWLWLSLEHNLAAHIDISKEKPTLWLLVGSLWEISERGERSPTGRPNSGKHNVLNTHDVREAGGFPDVPPVDPGPSFGRPSEG